MSIQTTICHLIVELYNRNKKEVADKTKEMFILEECFVMAKKMNRRLSELNNIPVSEKETEENWREEIKNS